MKNFDIKKVEEFVKINDKYYLQGCTDNMANILYTSEKTDMMMVIDFEITFKITNENIVYYFDICDNYINRRAERSIDSTFDFDELLRMHNKLKDDYEKIFMIANDFKIFLEN